MVWDTGRQTREWWTQKVDRIARQLRQQSQRLQSVSAESGLDANDLRSGLLPLVREAATILSDAVAVEGFTVYVAAEKGGTADSVAADLAGIAAAVGSVVVWIEGSVEADEEGEPIWTDGEGQPLVWTADETAGLRTHLAAVEAAIT